MKVTVIPIVIGVLRPVSKCLERRLKELKIRGRTETLQTKAMSKSAQILREILDSKGDLQTHRLQ